MDGRETEAAERLFLQLNYAAVLPAGRIDTLLGLPPVRLTVRLRLTVTIRRGSTCSTSAAQPAERPADGDRARENTRALAAVSIAPLKKAKPRLQLLCNC